MGASKVNLFDVMSRVNDWAPTDFIFASRPWSASSECRVLGVSDGEEMISDVDFAGDYFGEVFSFLEYFGESYFNDFDESKLTRVIDYAINDA